MRIDFYMCHGGTSFKSENQLHITGARPLTEPFFQVCALKGFKIYPDYAPGAFMWRICAKTSRKDDKYCTR